LREDVRRGRAGPVAGMMTDPKVGPAIGVPKSAAPGASDEEAEGGRFYVCDRNAPGPDVARKRRNSGGTRSQRNGLRGAEAVSLGHLSPRGRR
jgi:hypothetical protein